MSKGELSEIRRDPVSGEWVIIATGRSSRPDEFKEEKLQKEDATSDCPFCSAKGDDPFENPKESGNVVVGRFPQDKDDPAPEQARDGASWWVTVIENKYPIVEGNKCGITVGRGPYQVQAGAGYHEVVITRNHHRSLGQMRQKEVETVIESYLSRYRDLQKKDCATYILVFHNHGEKAGASISHPHSQIMAVPVVPQDAHNSLEGSKKYYKETNGECIHCAMNKWERQEGKRVVYENEHMLVVSPYVPRTAFELRIYPKKHESQFIQISDQEKTALAEALRVTLGKLYTALNDPAYNFFIHTAPTKDGEMHEHYHWHLEILPKISTPAGFELGTGMEVSAVDPDDAAAYIREATLPTSKE